MTAIALNERGFRQMSDGGDNWFPAIEVAISAVTAIGGFIGGMFVRNMGRARDDGQMIGELRAWKLAIEVQLAQAVSLAQQAEQRLIARVLTLESHRDNTATKQDLKDAVADIKDQLRDVVTEVRENRAHRVPPPSLL